MTRFDLVHSRLYVNRQISRFKRDLALEWANAKLRLKADLNRALPDDPVRVARIMLEVEETTMRRVAELQR